MGIFSRFIRKKVTPNCVPRALYQGAAWLYQEKKEVRFLVMQIEPGVDHIQCQVKLDGEWEWSTQDGEKVTTGQEEFRGYEPYKKLDWLTFLDERLQAEKQRVNRF